ncbi:armadillo-type protein [Spinellus fusiger]|nr:armadillo-type protein [Spinellus fusiger]
MRTIDDPSSVQYPENVIAPQAKGVDGKIQYDPVFLMQFQSLCLNTTEDLSAFQNIDEEYHDRHGRNGGGGNGTMQRRQTSERGRSSRPTGNPMEMGMFKHGSREGGGPMEMGKFSGGRILSHRAGSGGQGLPPAAQQGGMQRDNSHRGRSGRGGKGRHPPREQQGAPTIPLDQVVPLEKGNNRWVPVVLSSDSQASVGAASASEEVLISQETIVRKVKALLNKLTLEKFDSISDQIWEYAHQSSKEENGQSLRTVIQLTFDKACDEPPFAGMWAQLCRKMYNLMVDCDDIRDTTFKDSKGNFVSGGNLFRKYLLNKCQSDFERGWKFTVPELTEANKAEIMMSDEYYAAAKAKRQGLGLAQFIGELFKRGMLTDRIMLECLTKLCSKPNETEDEEAETMCKMLVTIGKDLDTTSRRNKEWMDTYFDRMREMSNSPKITSRIKFMIQDVSDMRKSKWVLRRGNQPAPTTISQIREEAQKAKNEEKETMKRTGSARGNLPHPVSRQTSHRGRDIQREGSASGNSSGNSGQATDGWSTVGTGVAASTGRNKAPDFPNFGKMERSKTRNNTFGPYNSQFPSSLNRNNSKVGDKKGATSDGRASPASPMTNMFSALGGEGQEEDKPQERRKLNLSPRGAGEKKPEEEASPVNILEEYFSCDKKELFESLVSRMLGVAEDVALVCDIINDLYAENLVEKTAYVNAFKPFMEAMKISL